MTKEQLELLDRVIIATVNFAVTQTREDHIRFGEARKAFFDSFEVKEQP